jgi:hypothetical protein
MGDSTKVACLPTDLASSHSDSKIRAVVGENLSSSDPMTGAKMDKYEKRPSMQ